MQALEISNIQMVMNSSNQKILFPRIESNHYLIKCDNSKGLENFKQQTQLKRNSVIYQRVQRVTIWVKVWMLLGIISHLNDFAYAWLANERKN